MPIAAAGRPETVYQVERLIENGAHEMGIDPLELRARNLIPPEKFPYQTAIGITYDSGDPPALMEKMNALADYDALRAEQAAAQVARPVDGYRHRRLLRHGRAPARSR